MAPVQYTIAHTIRYAYSQPVFLEPHEVALQPRSVGDQTLLEFEIQATPAPAGLSHCLDAEGNNVTSIWFNGAHAELTLRTFSRVQTLRENPFDYLLRPSQNGLPLQYEPAAGRVLGPAIRRIADPGPTDEVGLSSQRVLHPLGRPIDPLPGKSESSAIRGVCIYPSRDRRTLAPARTLAASRGSCRDVAVLFIDACRSLGVAARFVSGYQEGEATQDRREMHAWVEVYIPGAGWRGYDPTHGLAVADRHIAVAASAHSLAPRRSLAPFEETTSPPDWKRTSTSSSASRCTRFSKCSSNSKDAEKRLVKRAPRRQAGGARRRALVQFQLAIRLEGEDGLFHLSLASLCDDYLEFRQGKTLDEPEELAKITLEMAREEYFRAFMLSLEKDHSLKEQPIRQMGGLPSLVSYEAGQQFVELTNAKKKEGDLTREEADQLHQVAARV